MTHATETIKLKFRRPSKTVVAAVSVALVVCAAAMAAVGVSLEGERQRVQELKDQAYRLEQEKAQWEEKLDSVGSVDFVAQVAKDELGLVDPDTVIIQPEN